MATNWIDELTKLREAHPTAANSTAGGLLGAALLGGTSALTGQRAGETREERRNRILRNVAAGGIMGAGTGAAAANLPSLWSALMPEPSAAENAAQGLANEFSHDKPMGGTLGRVLPALGLSAGFKIKDRLTARNTISDKAREFVSRLSEASSKARAVGMENWGKLEQSMIQAHTDHATNIDAEVGKRVAAYGRAPEFKAKLEEMFHGKAADPAFQAELAKRVSASPQIDKSVIEQALHAETRTRLAEELTRAKGNEFRSLVSKELAAPKPIDTNSMTKVMEDTLHKSRMEHLSPLAREMQMDWGRTKAPGANMSDVDSLVRQLDELMAGGQGKQLHQSMTGSRLGRLAAGRFSGGYTGKPVPSTGNKALRIASLIGSLFTPEIMRHTPGLAAKSTDVIEKTFQP